MKTKTLSTCFIAICMFLTSCEVEDTNVKTVNLSFTNNAYTAIDITLNGKTKTMDPNDSVHFEVEENTKVNYKATTTGTTNEDEKVGLTLKWESSINLSNTDFTEQLDISSKYFFLSINNKDTTPTKISKLIVNDGSYEVVNTVDFLLANNSDQAGYYDALSGGRIQLNTTDSKLIWEEGAATGYSYKNSINQAVTLNVSNHSYSKRRVTKAISANNRNSNCSAIRIN